MGGVVRCASCAWVAWHMPTRRAITSNGRYCPHPTFRIVVRPNDAKTRQIAFIAAMTSICARRPTELMFGSSRRLSPLLDRSFEYPVGPTRQHMRKDPATRRGSARALKEDGPRGEIELGPPEQAR